LLFLYKNYLSSPENFFSSSLSLTYMQITKRRKSIRPVESITTEKSSVTRNTASSLAKLKDVSTKKRTATKKLSSLDTLQKRNSLVDKKAPVSLETSESPVDFPKRLSEEVNIAESKIFCLAYVLNQKIIELASA
jgi:hypothetical protein